MPSRLIFVSCCLQLGILPFVIGFLDGVATLIYDGLPLYDRGISLEPSMRRAEEHVLKKTGIHIELAEKPMYQENLTVDYVMKSIHEK